MVLPQLLDTVAVLISLNADRLLQVKSDAIARGCEYAMSILSAEELLVVHLELESVNPNLIAA
jgi:hypothetical protein